QDLDEIRIEKGTYECNGLEIPSSKKFEHGIKVSGGWDSGFVSQSDDAAVTVLDGGAKMIDGVENWEQCEEAGGVWKQLCFQEEPPSNGILSVSADGSVAIEGLFFQNGYSSQGGAISGNEKVGIVNCVFTNNSGGAVSWVGNIINSTFTNNSAFGLGGAVYDSGNISYSTFTNNSIIGYGGAVYGAGNITNSTFTNNSSSNNGGAVNGAGNIINSTFTNNSASDNGGAAYFSGSIVNSTFTNNNADENGGAVYLYDSSTITNSTFTKNSAQNGGAISGEYRDKSSIVNSTIVNNNGGGFYGAGTILNTIFAQNKIGEEANDITPYGDLHVDYTLVNNISGAVDLGTHFIMGEPRFVDAENGDFHLRSDSPAIDVGDDSVVEVEVDLDGNPRIVGGAIDLGAFERQ
ncbi:hypothetical protein PN36_17945, partial [Candidatus Thiomargarita nelsonii]